VLYRNKCKAFIAKGMNETPTSTYLGLFWPKVHVESRHHNFWFYVNDIHRRVEGWTWASILKHPSLPFIWLVMLCTNLTNCEYWIIESSSTKTFIPI
jgi:hypothetical protein